MNASAKQKRRRPIDYCMHDCTRARVTQSAADWTTGMAVNWSWELSFITSGRGPVSAGNRSARPPKNGTVKQRHAQSHSQIKFHWCRSLQLDCISCATVRKVVVYHRICSDRQKYTSAILWAGRFQLDVRAGRLRRRRQWSNDKNFFSQNQRRSLR